MSAEFEVKNKNFFLIVLFYVIIAAIVCSGIIHSIPTLVVAIFTIPAGIAGIIFPLIISKYLEERLHHSGMSKSRANQFGLGITLVSFSAYGVFLGNFF